jgi:hypothetical protein
MIGINNTISLQEIKIMEAEINGCVFKVLEEWLKKKTSAK